MDGAGKISVCIATYNGERYIREQLDSILSQLSLDDEVIISDDGSKDSTIEIISSYLDSRIKVFKNNGKHGYVGNFENALNHSSGDFIFLSDQDDIWNENKVKKCLDVLRQNDLVVHDAFLMNQHGNISDVNYFSIRKSGEGYWRNLYKNSFIGCCMAFKKEMLRYILPFPPNILWHDMWIGLVVERKGKVRFIQDKLLFYRRHGDNASSTAEKSSFSFLFKIKYRLPLFFYSFFK